MSGGESVGTTGVSEHAKVSTHERAVASRASLLALCSIASFHQVAAAPSTLGHQISIASTDFVTKDDLLRAVQHLGMKAKLSRSSIDRLGLVWQPAAVMNTEDASMYVVILAQSDSKRVLSQELGKAASIGTLASAGLTIKSAEVFASQWTSEHWERIPTMELRIN